jgi:hypothetical protein
VSAYEISRRLDPVTRCEQRVENVLSEEAGMGYYLRRAQGAALATKSG